MKETNESIEFKNASYVKYIAGMDEAGRGPLAGPVVCACCIMPSDGVIEGVKDSKQLSEARREMLYKIIIEKAVSYGVGIVERGVIDEINILNATKLGMKKAVEAMRIKPDFIYVDGNMTLDLPVPYQSVVKGDETIYAVSAASVIAKVTRDAIMRGLDRTYPQYKFAVNKGYPTKEHYGLIKKFGACAEHRKTFLRTFYERAEENAGK